MQNQIQRTGRRTGYEGVSQENLDVFRGEWGVQPERVDQLEVAIDEYDKVPDMIDEFVARIVELGPNPFKGM